MADAAPDTPDATPLAEAMGTITASLREHLLSLRDVTGKLRARADLRGDLRRMLDKCDTGIDAALADIVALLGKIGNRSGEV